MTSKAIEVFDWHKSFLDKSADEKTFILTKTILNTKHTKSNLNPNETVTIDNRDPPWIRKKSNLQLKKTES